MDPGSAIKSALSRMLLAILFFPVGVAFVIAACLSAGPVQAFKALFRRK